MSAENFHFVRRIASGPVRCDALVKCPDIWELSDGSFAVVGRDITESAAPFLPKSVGCGEGERIVVIPRQLLVGAKAQIPPA